MAAAAVPQQELYFPSDAQVLELVRSQVDEGRVKGVVVGLLEPNGAHRIISYGHAGEGNRQLGPKSVFEIGSINKTFTGTILADMARKGEVSLDDPVSKYLPPEVRVPSLNGRQITLLDLATHRSGLPRLPTGYRPPDRTNPYAHFDVEHLYAFLSSYELEREPGAEPVYSNLGMGLLGHALARASGASSFQDLVRHRILQPLGMTMTDFGRPTRLAGWMVKGHDEQGDQVSNWDVAVLAGAGGLNSNAEDMLKYLDANVGAPQSEIEKSMKEAQIARRGTPDPDVKLGLAWGVRNRGGQPVVSHEGGTAGYSSYIAFDPSRAAGVVILANSNGFDDINVIGLQLLDPDRR